MARNRTLWVVGVLAVLLVVGSSVAVWWRLWSHTEVKPWDPGSLSYVGNEVSLTYTGSECRDGVAVDVDERATEVVITVREVVRAWSCSDVGVTYDVQLRLSHPVGGRRVLDGTCSTDEWRATEDCQKPTITLTVE
ncbi:MAG: hypothetical protein ABIO16_15675 [Nocardioides sp.]